MASFTPSGIPVIDISSLTKGDRSHNHRAVADQFARHLPSNGCIGITGHGISLERLKEAFSVTKSLFDLSYEDKMKAPHATAIVPHSGYSSVGKEHLGNQDSKNGAKFEASDYKESYDIRSEENKIDYNIWLPEEVLPGFRAFTTKFFWELHQLSDKILGALILSLEATEEEAKAVKALYTGHENDLRLAHYFPIEDAEKGRGRLGAHTDWSIFTLLFQDENSGLEFQDRRTGGFLEATPQEGVIYMNIGDMFMRISNGFYPSALHRVVANEGATPDRYSIPYFVVPDREGVIEPLPSRVKEDGKSVYESVKYGEYMMSMWEKVR
ncbi:uncharacterized protein N0V89_006082 [Didymosphaeria variabile]|uniref:Fe2OG dioxygenase domain-containing protein n=1 Tax=Didymosphaeria variabile TaxID=1932322 RepID=A0A9W8XPQ5_9PLEO|nr:uncharacterized protein N0V89_006082 [Didymosphaeria variabile]KAJ4354347.1 hypothetical protein N0V89_006082 [Didymosphaeria variabile]